MLELACGTGIWTRRLATRARELTALDSSPEVLRICRERLGAAPGAEVSYVLADLFSWEPQQRYDVCFFGFWLSHVPDERWEPFWQMIERALSPAGRVFFIDSARSHLASAVDHPLPEDGEQTALRRLADGREFTIVKHWFERERLERRLRESGWDISVEATRSFFVYGHGRPFKR